MDDLEKALILTFDPTVPEDVKNQALAYTEQVKSAPEAWKFCLDRLGQTNSVHVKFFCFHIFQDVVSYKYATLNEQDKLKLKQGLIQWYQSYLITHPEDPAIKNKYAQVMVLIFKQEYPEQWPVFFDEFLGTLNRGPLSVDIFLRILKAIDDEVASFDVHRSASEMAQNMVIKDALRDNAIVRIVKAWYDILVHYYSTSPMNSQVLNMTLQNIKSYVGWIDINLIVNDQFIPIFCKFLSSRVLREEVCDCFKEIVNKGMDPTAKIALIKQLQITNIIKYAQLDDVDFIVKFGNLINLTGMEILRGIETVQEEQLLDEILSLLFQFFNNESDEVSNSVYGFASLYINKLKTLKQPINEKQLQHITMMVQIVRNKMKFQKDFYNEKDEDDNKFLFFRKELSNIFRNIFRICPDLVGAFIQQSLTNIINNLPPSEQTEEKSFIDLNKINVNNNNNSNKTEQKVIGSITNNNNNTKLNLNIDKKSNIITEQQQQKNSSTNFADIEVSIYLLFQMGESMNGTSEETNKQFEKFFAQMVILLSGSRISDTQHQVVSLIYFETIARYAKFIPHNSTNYSQMLAPFLDKRGINNRDHVVRKHAGYHLNRLAKQLKTQLFPFINVIIESLKNHLIISFDIQKEVPFEEQLHFYELIGMLIGVANLGPEQEQIYIEAILSQNIQKLEEITMKSLYKNDTKENPFYTTQLFQLILVIGTFSKGFSAFTFSGQSKTPQQTQYKKYFIRSLQAIMQLPGVLQVMNDEIKAKTLFYLHRMVDCLGKDLIPSLSQILSFLISNSQKTEILIEIITFFNQASAKFKEDMTPVLNDSLQPILQRVFKILNPSTPPVPNSDDERASNELKKTYYQFIFSSLSNGLSGAFISPINLPVIFEQILSTLLQGCFSQSESVQRTSFQSVKKMIDDYVTGGAHPLQGFNSFVYDRIIPIFFQVILSDQFSEFSTNQILGEVVKSLRFLYSKIGDDFANYLVTRFLPSLNLNPDQMQQFIKLLSPQSQLKDFQEYFKTLIKSHKLKSTQQQINQNQNQIQNNNNNNHINHTNGNNINGNHIHGVI